MVRFQPSTSTLYPLAPLPRQLHATVDAACRGFGAILVTGPRRSGKTTLLHLLRPMVDYHLLEDPDVLSRVKHDPRGFLDDLRLPAIDPMRLFMKAAGDFQCTGFIVHPGNFPPAY